MQADFFAVQLHRLHRANQLRAVQQRCNLTNHGSHRTKTVRKVRGGNQRADNTKRKNDDRDQVGGGNAACCIKQHTSGENRNQNGGADRIVRSHCPLAAFHPVIEVRRIFPDGIRVFSIGRRTLVKRLNDLNSVDIFHNRIVHLLIDLHGTLILLWIGFQNRSHKSHAHWNGNQGDQRHSPIQHEQIHNDENGNQHIRGHLREKMGQRCFQSLHPVNQNVF